MVLGSCGLLESLLHNLSFIEGRISTPILVSSEVQWLHSQIRLHLRMKRFVVTDNCVYDDEYFNAIISIYNSYRMH